MNILEKLNKQRAYWKTRNALKNLPVDTALDLDIYPSDADKIARRAVWG